MTNPSTLGGRVRPRLFIGLCTALAISATIVLSAAFSGAIYTSLGDGTSVNANIYDAKEDVYLNGGPQNLNGPGLPDGLYYFQVTIPSGALLLSTDAIQCRTVQVIGGVISGYVHDATCVTPDHLNGSFNPANGSTPVQLMPYLDTTNNGGEYKVWLTPVSAYSPGSGTFGFVGGNIKTDNFKVDEDTAECPVEDPDCECPPEGCGSPTENEISGTKFYDANVNGTQDPGEAGILGWHIESDIPASTTTDANGTYAFVNVPDGTYEVCEVIPGLAPTWIPTTPTSIADIQVPPDSTGNDFGNVCLGPGGGHTLGFWSNKNGQAMIDAGDLAALTALNLRNATGANFDPATAGALKTWLLNGTAVNMAYMLSVQLAAMKLNTLNPNGSPFVSGTALVYAGACGNTGIDTAFITINDLMTAANTSLGLYPNTTTPHPQRANQECLKNALDDANNNENFVQAEACDVNYSGLELSCLLP